MSVAMRATAAVVGALARTGDLNPSSLASGDALRARLSPTRRDARPPAWLRRRHDVGTTSRDGLAVVEVTARTRTSPLELVYLHGGAYVSPLHPAHWLIIDAIVARTGARVHVPFYALAPETTAADSLPPVEALIDELRATGAPVAVAGDSAGGGMSLAQAMRVRDAGGRPLAAAVLISPWLDVTMPSPQSRTLESRDVLLRCDGLIAAGEWWAGQWPTTDPRVSPARGDLTGLPPLTVVQGGRDIFLPDVRALDAAVRAAGGDIELAVFPDAFHVYPAARWTPEARQTWTLVAHRLRAAAGL